MRVPLAVRRVGAIVPAAAVHDVTPSLLHESTCKDCVDGRHNADARAATKEPKAGMIAEGVRRREANRRFPASSCEYCFVEEAHEIERLSDPDGHNRLFPQSELSAEVTTLADPPASRGWRSR